MSNSLGETQGEINKMILYKLESLEKRISETSFGRTINFKE